MSWNIEYRPEAVDDLKKLDGSQRIPVLKAIEKVSSNPLPDYEGGYGKPLGNKNGTNLSGFLKIKLKKYGIRVVYDLVREKQNMRIIIIGIRSDNEVYYLAEKRLKSDNS
ncbi:MAG: type II toxin-antitoxin system RelE/ParE family toxin [Schwartzia sp.]|nr:type II toxin-antitoxin system RelE/ParE family toxin [Schwartzia sp. (in: firmicutes)]